MSCEHIRICTPNQDEAKADSFGGAWGRYNCRSMQRCGQPPLAWWGASALQSYAPPGPLLGAMQVWVVPTSALMRYVPPELPLSLNLACTPALRVTAVWCQKLIAGASNGCKRNVGRQCHLHCHDVFMPSWPPLCISTAEHKHCQCTAYAVHVTDCTCFCWLARLSASSGRCAGTRRLRLLCSEWTALAGMPWHQTSCGTRSSVLLRRSLSLLPWQTWPPQVITYTTV